MLFIRNTFLLQFEMLRNWSLGNSSVSEYITKFEEFCKVSTIYQWNHNVAWKCVKFEGGLREDILTTIGLMKVRDFPTLVNKCWLVEDCNKKLVAAKSTDDNFRK